jgi:hypothetical protein
MDRARYGHTVTPLPDGKQFVAVGIGFGFPLLSSAELYDPGSGS